MFDYEWATVQHNVNCRLARRRRGSGRDPARAAVPLRRRRQDPRLPGLKEEYYLADFEPDPAVLAELGLDPAQPIAVVRTPPEVSLYHRFENDLFAQVLDRLRGRPDGRARRARPSSAPSSCSAGGFIVPERAIDAQSLIAYADLVVSAGGTMNREAVALGTPVFTVFEGRLGAVDERLIAEGRLRSAAQRRPAGAGQRGDRRR